MEKFITHTGIDVPLRRSNVNTDQIIPTVCLRHVTRTDFEDALFTIWRNDSKFVLGQDVYKNGSVLIAGPDFDADSSHEHAVQTLKGCNSRVVLAPKLADISRGNSGKQGLAIGIISQEGYMSLRKLLRTELGTEMTVSLGDKTWQAGAISGAFQVDDYVRWTLMEGLDDIALTLRHEDETAAYEAARPSFEPRTLPAKFLPKGGVMSVRDWKHCTY